MMKISWPVLLGLIVLAGCRKEDKLFKENSSSVAAETLSAVPTEGADSFYFKAVIDGTPVNWVVADQKQVSNALYRSGTSFGAGQLSSESETGGRFLVASTVIYKNNIQNVPQISAGFNIATTSGDKNELVAYFLPGGKAFGIPRNNAAEAVKDGVFVRYIDANGKEWVSYSGSSVQSNGSFESEIFTDETNSVDGTGSKRWKAKFSCKLFDSNGKSISLQNGEIYGPVF
jgi:hypothetical protein